MKTVRVLADDLTGATDVLSPFRAAGWPSYVALGRAADGIVATRGTAVAVSTGTRALSRREASAITRASAAGLMRDQSEYFYVKVDSTMRGSVAGQLEGAAQAWSKIHPECVIVLCPAYPRMGRVVKEGTVYVHGVRLDESPVGLDPITPVTSAQMSALVPQAIDIGPWHSVPALTQELRRARRNGGIVSLDAQTDEDLRRIVDAADSLGQRALFAGSAGLSHHVAQLWRSKEPPSDRGQLVTSPSGRIVVCISSMSDVSRRQSDHLRSTLRSGVIEITLSGGEDPNGAEIAELYGAALDGNPAPVVLVRTDNDGRSAPDTSLHADATARRLARHLEVILGFGGVAGLVLVGGDGAEATLGLLGAQALELQGQLGEGLPRSRIIGGQADGLVVATKAGAFGSDATLTQTATTLLDLQEGL